MRRRWLYLAPPFLVEDYEPAAGATARVEGAMAAKLDQGMEDFLEWKLLEKYISLFPAGAQVVPSVRGPCRVLWVIGMAPHWPSCLATSAKFPQRGRQLNSQNSIRSNTNYKQMRHPVGN